MNEKHKQKALDALDGMAQIVKNEMLVRGEYLTSEVVNESLAAKGAICGGHKACAIGSLWLGYGVKMEGMPGLRELPGTDEEERKAFTRTRPALRAALNHLNAAAAAFAEKNSITLTKSWDDPIEGLFEGYYGRKIDRTDLLRVVNNAKRRVRAA